MTIQILAVDDEQDILTSLKMLLTNDGYEVTTATRGKEALELLATKKFDLVILDLLMPEMAGNEVAQRIRNKPETKNQKLIFLTVISTGDHGLAEIEKLQPADYIQKPFTSADLRKRIKKVLASA